VTDGRRGAPSSPAAATARRTGIPQRLTPILYFATAHAALLVCLAVLFLYPALGTGFFYQPRVIALVHLITLGWITSSILGSLYVISPMALRTGMPQGRGDVAVWLAFAIGLSGVASHFWINTYGGVGWAALLVLVSVLHVGIKAARGAGGAPIQGAVRLCLAMANLNIVLAGGFGILLAFDRVHPFLPARELGNVFAHAHLAAIGWAGMMVMGAGLRMIPMILPSAMPKGRMTVWGAVATQVGVLGLALSLLFGGVGVPFFASLVAAGFVGFLGQIFWMLRHRRPGPVGLPRPDLGVWHAAQSLLYLAASIGAGLILAFAPESELTYRLAPLYGVFGLLGFLGQLVVGVEARVLPLFAAYHANRNVCEAGPVILPHEMVSRPLQWTTFLLWSAGIPLLALGASRQSGGSVRLGAILLFCATASMSVNAFLILRHAFLKRPSALSGAAPPAASGRA
jgi:hypothetical protein